MASASNRIAMRILSPRYSYLQRSSAITLQSQIRRASSRYSNPTKRASTVSGGPAQAPSFVPPPVDHRLNQPHDGSLQNPLDARQKFLDHEQKRQHSIRRMRFAGMGLLMTLAGLAMVLFNLDLDRMDRDGEKAQKGQQLDASSEANQRFQGKEVHVIGAGEGKRIVAQGTREEIELVETGTSSVPHFPRTIYLPTSPESSPDHNDAGGLIVVPPNVAQNAGNHQDEEQYTLIGLGIRSVSFLSIQVYVVGMYIRTADIGALQEQLVHRVNGSASTLIPSESERLRQTLLDPASSREIWNELLKVPGLKTAWRIAPTRNTDFGHLRDGWITGINNRTREAKALTQGVESEYDSDAFGTAIGDFKRIFQGGRAPKGSVMILSRIRNGALDVWFQAKPDGKGKEQDVEKLGSVTDERIARLIWLGYLGGEKVSSEGARKGVAEGCVSFASRPIGSVETMVT